MRTEYAKQPYCFEVGAGELFAFAGLWERWKDPTGQWIKSCSILTTAPNPVTAPVHDRMPVIFDPDAYDPWLDPGMTKVETVSQMLKPYDARQMRCFAVSSRVNSVVNDDEECCHPVESMPAQNQLFS
jgi:putative SOS response-associated peptidase YedK